MNFDWLDRRPIIVAIAGPNGAGKTTFFSAHVAPAGLRFVSADDLARHLELSPYQGAVVAASLRDELVRTRESFIFETVFSDPVGDKLQFLKDAAAVGYHVVLCFIGLNSTDLSEQRVAMRVAQGGHDVPSEKLKHRFPRTMANLKKATRDLPHVMVFDNSDLSAPFRQIAIFEDGKLIDRGTSLPTWFAQIVS
ncbi:MAG: zeta toxin family protein [Pirellulales bacterium]